MNLRAAMREFYRPRCWLGLWLFGWLLCVVLSMIPPPPVPMPGLPAGDKLGHVLAYALLSAWAVWIFAGSRHHRRAALALCALGIALEFAQGGLTRGRMMEGWDVVADALGVLAGWLLAAGPARGLLQAIDRRLFAPR